MNFFNHIFSLQYVLSSSILKILPYIHVQIKLIQMQTIKILVLRLICIFFFWHLNLTVAKDSITPKKCLQIKENSHSLKHWHDPVIYSLDNISIGTPPRTTSANFHPQQNAITRAATKLTMEDRIVPIRKPVACNQHHPINLRNILTKSIS